MALIYLSILRQTFEQTSNYNIMTLHKSVDIYNLGVDVFQYRSIYPKRILFKSRRDVFTLIAGQCVQHVISYLVIWSCELV